MEAPGKTETKTEDWLNNGQSTEGQAKDHEKRNLRFTITLVADEPINTSDYAIKVENGRSYTHNNFTVPKEEASPNKVHLTSPTNGMRLSALFTRNGAPAYAKGLRLGATLAPNTATDICYEFQASSRYIPVAGYMARSAEATITVVDSQGHAVSDPTVISWSGPNSTF